MDGTYQFQTENAAAGFSFLRTLLDGGCAWANKTISPYEIFASRRALFFSGSLQDIPASLYEAAEIDGANGWNKFWRITLPLMTPVIFFNLVVGLIGNFSGEADFMEQRECLAGTPRIYGQLVQILGKYSKFATAGEKAAVRQAEQALAPQEGAADAPDQPQDDAPV